MPPQRRPLSTVVTNESVRQGNWSQVAAGVVNPGQLVAAIEAGPADGRVYGHLAAWGTCHIGYGGQCVQPPSSSNAYKYFHSGTVETGDGPLPVGVLTLGTGHAPIRRDVDGAMELVAALAVNVPGFPVPRTEQLVAAGGVGALVAAGVVAPPDPTLMPQTPAELSAFVAAAADRRDRAARARSRLAEVAAAVRAVGEAAPEKAKSSGSAPKSTAPKSDEGRVTDYSQTKAKSTAAKSSPKPPSVSGEKSGSSGGSAKKVDVSAMSDDELSTAEAKTQAGLTSDNPGARAIAKRLAAERKRRGQDQPKQTTTPDTGTADKSADTSDKPKPMKTDAPVRDGGKPGERMEEDQSPTEGADGGKMLDYDGTDGKALYDDGTMTDGKQWYRVSDDQLAKAKAARAARDAKAKAAQARTASAVAAIMAAGVVRPKA